MLGFLLGLTLVNQYEKYSQEIGKFKCFLVFIISPEGVLVYVGMFKQSSKLDFSGTLEEIRFGALGGHDKIII